ncbi:TPR Domain containing protein [Trichomonas vaginalis G3]|uniref:TPR Domain containing protein n=1 Tax=Trichomonas vaginalis (strain ATCC PRA-98 / G3) TaxID=412133 RepID=A2FV69_TRIV3|nr:positive regulation of catalytic activity protein [Trichomonas vaginalis G3]EAX91205.1 TPR Domain containing protein [Trichomonas vaginalis G3]KAI5517087.1 positive regulation of catalytic activity protein [Trichomonas vaginalis G3]|eukprot:XP_001304135.1 TPR Domain containing protein [Trichomonas vaginalis G3]
MSGVDELKAQGNKFFNEHNYPKAIECYTDAIDLDPTNYALYSNRSGAYCASQKYQQAAADARKVIEIKPDWPRGHSRLGAALQGLHDYEGAAASYRKVLELDPNNAGAKEDLAACENAIRQQQASAGANPFANLGNFFRPENFDALRYNPKTAAFFNDPGFVKIIDDLKANPKNFQNYASDNRVQVCMEALLEPLLQSMQANQKGSSESPNEEDDEEEPVKPAPQPKEEEKPKPEAKPKNDEAEAEKEEGNKLFKEGNIEGAIEHYDKAIEIEPHNVTFYNNKATALTKLKKYQEAVDVATKGIELGRQHGCDYETIAKAYTKIATAEAARGNLEAAIAALNSSLLEKKDPTVKRELTRLEQLKAKRDAAAYENPEIAEQEKEAGNKCFREGNIPEAIQHYNEAIKRAPRDARLYSNRAGAYSKLGEMPMAIKDCDKAIELDPKFVKAYTRKGYCHIQMKEYHKALDDYNEALRIDPNNAEAIGGIQSVNAAIAKNSYTAPDEEQIRHAMADPEIQRIMQDPTISNVLRTMQENPMEAQKYLSDPTIRDALMKLRAAGILR